MLGLLTVMMAIPASAALLHHYPLDSDGRDTAGLADLTALGSVSHTTGGVNGGCAVFVDGNDDAYRGDAALGCNFGLLGDYDSDGMGHRPFTIVLWAKTTQTTGSVCAFGLSTEGANTNDVVDGTYQHTGFFVRTRSSEAPNTASVYARGGGSNSQVFSKSIADGYWHQIVGIFGGTYRKIYVDGINEPGWNSSATVLYTTNLPVRFVTLGSFWRRNNQFVDGFTGNLDDVQVYSGALTAGEIKYLYDNPGRVIDSRIAGNPAPADGLQNVALTDYLTWAKGSDPNITGYYLYSDFNNTQGDTNLYLKTALNVNDTDYGNQAGETLGLVNGKTYHWRVDQAVNGSASTDPNTIPGFTWTFTTIYSIPQISGINPLKAKYNAGQTAQMTASYVSAESPVTSVTWYHNDIAINPASDSNLSITFNNTESTLTISSMSEDYNGDYSCIVTNAGGNSDPSVSAAIALKIQLAGYPFEQNGDDSVRTNHGTVMGSTMDYSEGIITTGQSYAADPNGSNYMLLTTEAYPKAGYGNGLDEFTISCWIKDSSSTGNDIIVLGNMNGLPDAADRWRTAFEFGLNASGNLKHFYRDEDNHEQHTQSGGLNLRDGQWHYIAAVRSDNTVILYADGEAVITGNAGQVDNFGAWEHPTVILADNIRGVIQKFFPGMVDDLQIYNYALSAEEIAQTNYDITGKSACFYPPAARYNLVNTGSSYCRVDMADFAALASHWMDCGLFPDCE
jgi:hypothetical protein